MYTRGMRNSICLFDLNPNNFISTIERKRGIIEKEKSIVIDEENIFNKNGQSFLDSSFETRVSSQRYLQDACVRTCGFVNS